MVYIFYFRLFFCCKVNFFYVTFTIFWSEANIPLIEALQSSYFRLILVLFFYVIIF